MFGSTTSTIMLILWIVLIVITIIIELETSDLITVWFTLGAIAALISSAFDADPMLQVAIFIGVSLILIVLTRPLTKKMMKTEIVRTNADKVIGMQAVVTKVINPDEIGEVKVDNSLWRAISLDNQAINVGERVTVNAISGIKLIVTKLDKEENINL
ncbi:MAG: NfeD family protein [Bacilli bacterium]